MATLSVQALQAPLVFAPTLSVSARQALFFEPARSALELQVRKAEMVSKAL